VHISHLNTQYLIPAAFGPAKEVGSVLANLFWGFGGIVGKLLKIATQAMIALRYTGCFF
jgi:hypothetical protein